MSSKTNGVYKRPIANQIGVQNRGGGAKVMPVVMTRSKGHAITGGQKPPRTTGK